MIGPPTRACTALAAAVLAGLLAGASTTTARAAHVATPLPVLRIDMREPLRNEPKATARLRVSDRPGAALNLPGDPPNAYDGWAGVELRGKSSLAWPKKSMTLETRGADGADREVALLGLPRESDWVLNASHADRSYMRNQLGFETARRIGLQAPRSRYVEVVLDGAPAGLHLLTEAVEIGKRRVQGRRGAMLLELSLADKVKASDESFPIAAGVWRLVFHDPDPDTLSRAQKARARRVARALDRSFAGALPRSRRTGWRRWLAERPTVDYVLFQELFDNQDAFSASAYFVVGPTGRLRPGPVWDLDLTAGNTWAPGREAPDGWASADRPWGGPLLEDAAFRRALARRWRALRAGGLLEWMQRRIDVHAAVLAGPAARDLEQWGTLTAPPQPGLPARSSYADEVAAMKAWFAARAAWLDRKLAAR